jgi:3-oxoacyl-[acyl-carrier-protein] synthase-3
MNISLIDIEENMPDQVIGNDFFGEEEIRRRNRMFSGTFERRHLKRDELASDYFAVAIKNLMTRLNLDPAKDIDLILTNVSLPDEAFTGCGAVVSKKTGAHAKYIIDIHNTGCVSFLYLLDIANTYMAAKKINSAVICLAQTAAGRIFGQEDTRQLAQAAIPGDGFAVAYVTSSDERPVLSMEFESYPENSEDMRGNTGDKKWWEARNETGSIDFNENKTAMIVARGNKAVPGMIKKVCANLDMKTTDINYLITNQPNLNFLRNWREATQLTKEQHLDTFNKYANLFGAGIPVTLAESIKNKTIKPGDMVCLAGFSHACDYSAGALIRWT